MKRRDFLTIGGCTGLASLGLPNLSFSQDNIKIEKSIIFVFLSGGIAHPEAFTSNEESPVEYRSVSGTINTAVENMRFGGHFENLAKHAKDLTVVNSFMHDNNDHDRATHYVMTGYYQGNAAEQKAPSYGSIISNMFGPISKNGLPVYMVDGRINGDKAAYLGSAYQPFDINSGAARNFVSQVDKENLYIRGQLLNSLDKFHKDREEINNLTKVKNQAIDMILGQASRAFNLKEERPEVVAAYGDGLGKKMLMARRLVQFGVRFVSIETGGWDMHSNIKEGVTNLCPPLDKALSTLLTDLKASGMIDNTLVIVSSEFGRTPKINPQMGRDHHSAVNSLLIAGGKYNHGRAIGKVDNKGALVTDSPYKPLDLLHTIMDYYEIPKNTQKTDLNGRPMYLLDGSGTKSKNILV